MNESFAAIGRTIVAEFSDLHDVTEITRVTVRLPIAATLGARPRLRTRAQGQGRWRPHRHAGIARFGGVRDVAATGRRLERRPHPGDAGRDLGHRLPRRGAILKRSEGEGISGLTTAAGIWMTAAIGMAAGLGREATAVPSTSIALCTFALGSATFEWLGRRRQARYGTSPDEMR